MSNRKNDAIFSFVNTFQDAAGNIKVPLKTKGVKQNKNPAWWDNECKTLRNKSLCRFQTTRKQFDLEVYLDAKRKFKTAV